MFLKRYNLSCVLADDMGLGKVRFYQTICVLKLVFVLDTSNNLRLGFGYCRTKKRGLEETKTLELMKPFCFLFLES